ncbi:hypothetical protein [Amycolatopsis sp. WQ 127309]|uniref:hypothetical protein n=1 Tax=Amycolatopsis sp. WQ 127309 TaxID=2932773 RepID=UPI001FF354DE|nr:hypothetical protein [Amycolatopsis sp. WQ 127309]UOZ10199.1 hypothetical protein MUY22_18830 [Amycolatopsis sp. WQ 127309]
MPDSVISLIPHSRLMSDNILLLPTKVEANNVALYLDQDAGFVKSVRAEGVNLSMATDKDKNRYLSEYSAGEVIAQILLGVVGNLSTDYLKMTVIATRVRIVSVLAGFPLNRSKDRVRISIAELKVTETTREASGVTLEIPVGYFTEGDDTVANILAQALGKPGQSVGSNQVIDDQGETA